MFAWRSWALMGTFLPIFFQLPLLFRPQFSLRFVFSYTMPLNGLCFKIFLQMNDWKPTNNMIRRRASQKADMGGCHHSFRWHVNRGGSRRWLLGEWVYHGLKQQSVGEGIVTVALSPGIIHHSNPLNAYASYLLWWWKQNFLYIFVSFCFLQVWLVYL